MNNIKNKTIKAVAASSLAVALAFGMTGCFGGGGSDDTSVKVKQQNVAIQLNADNPMCNNGLKMKVTGIQRRPTSIFAGSSLTSSVKTSQNNDQGVSNAGNNSVVIQVDIEYTWNINTYIANVEKATGRTPSVNFRTLSDVLIPGELMYVSGTDADGAPYKSNDIIAPAAQENVNALAINAQWDYDVLNSALPETSVTKTGSFLLRVPSTVNDLTLNWATPSGGQDISTGTVDISTGSATIYTLSLT